MTLSEVVHRTDTFIWLYYRVNISLMAMLEISETLQ